jgi:hypothetical protein
MTAGTKLAAMKCVVPMRSSPADGSARNSILFTLAQIIEYGRPAIKEGAAKLGWLDALAVAV